MRMRGMLFMGRSQKLSTTSVTWKPKAEIFQTIAEKIANNKRINILMSELKVIVHAWCLILYKLTKLQRLTL